MSTMTEAPEAPALPGLTLTDYCDGEAPGQVQAYVRVAKGRRDLDLCKHHFEVNEPALLAGGWTVTDDQRHTLA